MGAATPGYAYDGVKSLAAREWRVAGAAPAVSYDQYGNRAIVNDAELRGRLGKVGADRVRTEFQWADKLACVERVLQCTTPTNNDSWALAATPNMNLTSLSLAERQSTDKHPR